MLALTQETQLLRFSQVSGGGMVTGPRVVSGVEAAVVGAAEVPFGATEMF